MDPTSSTTAASSADSSSSNNSNNGNNVAVKDKVEKSYLSAAADYIPSWGGGSRSATPKPTAAAPPGESSGLKNQHGGDHQTQHWHGLSRKRYPADCPPLNARWFYAVDAPKRKPKLIKNAKEDEKPLPPPKKFVAFTPHDSSAIEAAYQELADSLDDPHQEIKSSVDEKINVEGSSASHSRAKREHGHAEKMSDEETTSVKVPVHEDFLFDVDISHRELTPVYWLGPIYEVRRGSWFYQEGTTQRACEENLAAQLEEGYLKVKPFRYPKAQPKPASRPTSTKPGEGPSSLALSGAFSRDASGSGDITPKASSENLRAAASSAPKDPVSNEPQTHRLFGAYMNSVVTYQDATVAWLSADTLISRMSSTVYQRFAGGGYLSGVKLVRGYVDTGKGKDVDVKGPATPTSATVVPTDTPTHLQLDEKQQKMLKRRSAPSSITQSGGASISESAKTIKKALVGENEQEADESDMRNDYNERENENQARGIDHLILVTHGIGQRLGMRTESVNFIHDVNVLRQTLKSVYEGSADLQALNSEIDKLPKNCRIQVLPICWRHLLDFPKKNVRQSRKEQDLGDAFGDEDQYPSLEDITPDGVQFMRSLISDLALDILLYQSSYRDDIIRVVLAESNRIYHLFRQRNPSFSGKVSLIGHSLGSAIYFDLLCRQKESLRGSKSQRRRYGEHARHSSSSELEFDFDVEDFYCLGSPIGLFQMLKGRNILARHSHENARPAESPLDPEMMQDPFLAGSASGIGHGDHVSHVTGLPHTISSPKVAQLFNVFYPSDPISYRLEPLISSAASKMNPQQLPYTKKTYAATVSGLGAKVGQSVSGLWSSFSAAMTSSMLNKSLGLTSEDVARIEAQAQTRSASQTIHSGSEPHLPIAPSSGAGTNITAGGVIAPPVIPTLQREKTNEKMRQLAANTAAADREGTKDVPVLIDDEIETLFAGFEKRQKSEEEEKDIEEDWTDAQKRRLRREEAKLKALNRNGRVDYSIQEGVLDFNPMSTIASHLGYWADEDVAHFLMSQSLARHRSEQQMRTQKP